MQTTAKTKPVQFRGKDIIVKELSLRKISKLAESLEELAGQIDKDALASEDMQRIIPAVSKLIRSAPDKIVEVFQLGADVTADEILDATPTEIVGLGLEIWHVNNLVELFRKKVQPVMPEPPGAPKPSAA